MLKNIANDLNLFYEQYSKKNLHMDFKKFFKEKIKEHIIDHKHTNKNLISKKVFYIIWSNFAFKLFQIFLKEIQPIFI